jgi:hypothetical protein
MFGRDKLVKATEEVLDHVKLVENVRALQIAQKELADAIVRIDEHVRSIETDYRALKAEIRSDALQETQSIVNSVQSSFYQKLQDVAVDMALLKHDLNKSDRSESILAPGRPSISFPRTALAPSADSEGR